MNIFVFLLSFFKRPALDLESELIQCVEEAKLDANKKLVKTLNKKLKNKQLSQTIGNYFFEPSPLTEFQVRRILKRNVPKSRN